MRTILPAIFIFFGFSCNKVTQPLTRDQIRQKADSISGIRIRQADEQAKTDLEYRMKIEVKVKVDSILNARMRSAAGDTAKKIPNNPANSKSPRRSPAATGSVKVGNI